MGISGGFLGSNFVLPETNSLTLKKWWERETIRLPFGKVHFQGRTVCFGEVIGHGFEALLIATWAFFPNLFEMI